MEVPGLDFDAVVSVGICHAELFGHSFLEFLAH
jgi:hypothetical protein